VRTIPPRAAVGPEDPTGKLAGMAFDDGPDDERPDFREPPPPDDRLWRHPSEVTVAAPRVKNHSWATALCAGSVGALVATGVIAATGGLRRDVTIIRPTGDTAQVDRLSTQPVPDLEVDKIAERVRPSIAQVRVTTGAGPVNGSGVMFRSDGHVLTNWHLVGDAQTIKVVMANGKEVPGRLVGADRDTDLAIVKVDGGPYTPATLGTATALKLGQRAIALGSPSDLAGGTSVTVGVVSALHRQVDGREGVPLLDMIQTDAPVSSGSSGGALLDSTGKVIGITTAVAAGGSGADGLGVATPIETAHMVGDQLIANGRFIHVWLGIEGSDVDGGTAALFGIDGGALVDKVTPGGPAERAGLAVRDIIVGIEEKLIASMGALVVNLRGRPPGEVVVLDVLRDSKRRELSVTLAERPTRP
jgi:S1-C subfamily serine protease